MSQELEGMSIEKLSIDSIEPLTWFQTWLMAFFHPSVSTFQQIAIDPNATFKRSILWVFGGNLIGQIALSLISGWFGEQEKPEGYEYFLSGVIAVLSLILVAWLTHIFAAKIFHGNGSYGNLTYALAAIYAPLLLVSGVIGGFPCINVVALPLFIYATLAGATAVSAVYGIGRGKGAIAFSAGLVIVFGIIVVVSICILTFIGPDLLEEFQKLDMKYEA